MISFRYISSLLVISICSNIHGQMLNSYEDEDDFASNLLMNVKLKKDIQSRTILIIPKSGMQSKRSSFFISKYGDEFPVGRETHFNSNYDFNHRPHFKLDNQTIEIDYSHNFKNIKEPRKIVEKRNRINAEMARKHYLNSLNQMNVFQSSSNYSKPHRKRHERPKAKKWSTLKIYGK